MRNAENEVGPNEEFVRVPGFLHLSPVLVEKQKGGEDVSPQVDDLHHKHGDERGEFLVFQALCKGLRMVEERAFSRLLVLLVAEGANERVDEEDRIDDDEKAPEAELEAEKARKVLLVELGVAVAIQVIAAQAASAYQHRSRQKVQGDGRPKEVHLVHSPISQFFMTNINTLMRHYL